MNSHNDSSSVFDYSACLGACARGERYAFHTLYQVEAPKIRGIILRIVGNPDLASDLTQDVFLKIWDKAHTFDAQRSRGRAWIHSVARHHALDEIRRRAQPLNQTSSEQVEELPSLVNDERILANLELNEATVNLSECLKRLETDRRTAIYMAFVEGHTHEEISKRMGTPLGTVKSWARRSLKFLRDCLK